jgi:hypothetical protein
MVRVVDKETGMAKRRFFRFFVFSCAMATASLLLGSCLNPVSFNSDELPVLKVAIEGSIKIDDVAVMWLINRSKTVNVTQLTINRPQGENEAVEQYVYPKNYDKRPAAGTSLATYHNPTAVDYTITVVWEDTAGGGSGVIGPFEAQFPRALDYKFYLYRARNGEIVVVTEDKMRELPPDPEDTTFPAPGTPSIDNAHTMVVINATPDQGIDAVEFFKSPYTYVIAKEPKAKDQEMILLGAGSYEAKVHYTRGGAKKETTAKNAIVTGEGGGMAVRTNFLYFYKTTAGDYQITQSWPPYPNDASDENKPESSLQEGQGILEIVNNAVPNNPHSLIARININGDEYPNSTNTSSYMGPGDAARRYILPVGDVHVSFRPTDQTYYGQTSIRQISSRQVTTLSYTNDLGNPFVFPEDSGNGTGLIRITNNTDAVVTSVDIVDRADLSKSLSVGYEGFNPPYPINYGKVGLVPVSGTGTVPLNPGVSQLIQILLESGDGLVTVERVAALRGQIVDIVLSRSSLQAGGDDNGGRRGSKVVVRNNTGTPTNILALYVYNADDAAATAIYALEPLPEGREKSLYVLSTAGLPIVEGARYKARLGVYGNKSVGVIEKEFSPDGNLYSKDPDAHVRYITLEQPDLLPGMEEAFVPVTGITISPSPAPLNSVTEANLDGTDEQLKVGRSINLNQAVVVAPAGATKRSPISWSLSSGATGYVSLAANGVLTVTGIAPAGNRNLTLTATIEGAAGTLTHKTNFTAPIQFELTYERQYRTRKVSGITLGNANVQAGTTLDLRTLVTLNPGGANINGVPITADGIVWSITGGASGSSINGYTFTAGTSGDIAIKATLPADANGGTQVTQATTIHIVPGALPFKAVAGVSLSTPVPKIDFFTQNKLVGGVKTKYVNLGGVLGITAYLTFDPPDATNQLPVWWEAVGGDTPYTKDKVFFREPPARADLAGKSHDLVLKGSQPQPGYPSDPTLGSLPLPYNGEKVKVRARVVNGGGIGLTDFYSHPSPTGGFEVEFVEHYDNTVVDLPGDFWLDDLPSVQVGAALVLQPYAHLPAGATHGSNTGGIPAGPTTTDDLVWSVTGGSVSGSTFTAPGSAGTVTVRATLPGPLNNGLELYREKTIAVTPAPAAYPANLTLRVFRHNESNDSIKQVVLVLKNNSAYSGMPYSTGYTGAQWTPAGTDLTHKTAFEKVYPPSSTVRYFTVAAMEGGNLSSDWAHVDISVPWPAGGTGYEVFFIEGDGRVRGYVTPGKVDPPQNTNYVFFVNPEYLYTNGNFMRMNGDKEAGPASSYPEVLPLCDNTYKNQASVMKSQGAGNRPRHDTTGLN